MAFKNISVTGTGADATVMTLATNEELVITSFSVYNSNTVPDTVQVKVNNTIVYIGSVPAGSSIQETVKIAGKPSDSIIVNLPSTSTITFHYMIQPVDIQTAVGIVQDVVNSLTDIQSVATNVVPNMTEILAADTNAATATTKAAEADFSAQLAQSTTNYKGDWNNVYNNGLGYSLGDSVTVGRRKYMSKVDANTDDPSAQTGTWELLSFSEWAYVTVTANYSALPFDFIKADTSSNAISITLPATPLEDDKIKVHDVKGTFDTNAVTIVRGGINHTIMGVAEDMVVNTKNVSFELMYINGDWRLV